MNLLEQKIRKQMIDETMIGRGLGRLKDSKVGRGVGKGLNISGEGIARAYRGGKKAGQFVAGLEDKNFLTQLIGGAVRAGGAALFHAGVGRISDLATQGLGGGDDRVGPTNTPMGAKADVARGSGDFKKAANPLRSFERTLAPDDPKDFKDASKILGGARKEAKKRKEIKKQFKDAKLDIQQNTSLSKIEQAARIRNAKRDRDERLGQIDSRVMAQAIAKQKRGFRSQVAALAGGETEAEKAAQFLRYLRGRDRDR